MSSPVTTSRNRDQWLDVAQFLGGFVPAFDRLAASLEAASDCVGVDSAALQPLPDGNHGENLNQAQA